DREQRRPHDPGGLISRNRRPAAPRTPPERSGLLDSLDRALRVEQGTNPSLDVDGERVTVHGIVDLGCVADGRVESIGYKTGRGVTPRTSTGRNWASTGTSWTRGIQIGG
ncbi:MAG: hypothetical protein ACOC2A_03690, partial [Halanaeroarchaeum sp.]